MTWILADVGGTNVRFAASADLRQLTHLQRFENDAYLSFEAVLEAYLAGLSVAKLSGLCVAVAGPVTGNTARLTNRGWGFDAAALSVAHQGVPVYLMNDLGALGYALGSLGSAGLDLLNDVDVQPNPQEQRLVLGVGTGLNVSPVLTREGHVICARAEAGLSSPPARVLAPMLEYLGARPDWAVCVEDVVSGLALGRLHGEATGQSSVSGQDVSRAAEAGDAAALRTLDVFARMLGALVQDLRLQYMPSHGVFFAGSVVRALLAGPVREDLIAACCAQPTPKSTLPAPPLGLITQDEAALLGCLAYAVSVS